MNRNYYKWMCILAVILFSTSFIPVHAENYPYRSDYLWLTLPDHADWLYKTGEMAKVEVTLCQYGIPQNVEVSYEIGQDMLPARENGKVMLKNGRATINMGTMKKPGFLDLRLKAAIGGKTYEHHAKVGFSPEQLKPYTKNPSDFDAFWQKTIEDARKGVESRKMITIFEKVEKYSTDDVECFLVKLHTDRQHSIYGYLTMPKDCFMANSKLSMANDKWSTVNGQSSTKKYPIVLCPPGAGIKTIKEPMRNHYYAQNGFIRFEMEIHGLHPEMTAEQFGEISSAFSGVNGYLENGLDNRDNYYMKHVYTACVRAIDFLCSLPDWDGKNVFVQGGSQGGALSLITAGLDERVTGCVANHPALSDMAGYAEEGRTGGYPHFRKESHMLTTEKIGTMQYYDVVNFARRIKCPVYLTWGYNDNVCPPTTSYIVWNLITSKKDSLITPINEHWTTSDTGFSQMQWLKKLVQ